MTERFLSNSDEREALIIAGEAYRELRSYKMPKIWRQCLDKIAGRIDVFKAEKIAPKEFVFTPRAEEQKELINFQPAFKDLPPLINWYFLFPKNNEECIFGNIDFSKNPFEVPLLHLYEETHPLEIMKRFSLQELTNDRLAIQRDSQHLIVLSDRDTVHYTRSIRKKFVDGSSKFKLVCEGMMNIDLALKQFVIPN